MTGVSEKQCPRCKETKPLTEFHKDASGKDGRHVYCKPCRRKQAAKPTRREARTRGIDGWCQVDSVLREMSEIEHTVNIEQAACEKQIARIKKDSQQRIEPYQVHQSNLRTMLEGFVKKSSTKTKTINRSFRFGSVRLFRGKVNVGLNVWLAAKRKGKP